VHNSRLKVEEGNNLRNNRMKKATTRTPELFLTIVEAADELKISDRSLRSLIAAGEVRATRLGKRIVRIPRAEIERLAAVEHRRPSTEGQP
jgi:excisionase family DNA binding protein